MGTYAIVNRLPAYHDLENRSRPITLPLASVAWHTQIRQLRNDSFMATDQADTIIGANVELTGSLKNRGSIAIHGQIKGDVFSEATVLVGEGAHISGPISAKHIEVAGKVTGSLHAETSIDLLPKSVVKGDIETKQLSIKPGAIFAGTSKMTTVEDTQTEETDAEVAPRRKPRLEIE